MYEISVWHVCGQWVAIKTTSFHNANHVIRVLTSNGQIARKVKIS